MIAATWDKRTTLILVKKMVRPMRDRDRVLLEREREREVNELLSLTVADDEVHALVIAKRVHFPYRVHETERCICEQLLQEIVVCVRAIAAGHAANSMVAEHVLGRRSGSRLFF